MASGLALTAAAAYAKLTGSDPPMSLGLLAVVASAYAGGQGAGLLAVIFTAVGSAWFVFHVSQAPDAVGHWLAAIGGGLAVSWASGRLHAHAARQREARDRAEQALEGEIASRERHVEATRRSSEVLFELAFNASPVAKCITNVATGEYVAVNEAYERLVGYDRDELVGHSSRELGILRPGVREELVRMLVDARTVRALDIDVRTKGGETRRLLTNAELIRIGGVEHMLVASVDITERLVAEAKARERDARFCQLAESVREVFYLYDRETEELLYCNHAYEQIWGQPLAELYERPTSWIDSVHPDDRDRARAMWAHDPAQPYAGSYRILAPDGGVRWIEARHFPVHDPDGKVVRVAGIADDVTERRRLEDQLAQGQKLESVGLLAGGVAHDFNNVLTIVLTCAELLRREAGDAQRELVDDILQAVTRATSLTRQLLVFSRRDVVEPRVLDLNAQVVDAEKMLRRLIGEDVVLATALAPVLGRVRIDPNQLMQALMNLVVNARDAMPRGGNLTISTSDVIEDDHRCAVIRVTDTGEGMSPEVQARVFEPFYTTKAPGRGTGMGLSVTHGIVHQAGGTIGLESAVGAGTTFTICLPCVADASGESSTDHPAIELGGGDTALVVEDADDVRKATARALEACGFRVLAASCAADGLALLARHPEIRVLITDVVMPGMDGRELAEEAARLAPSLSIVFTSGYTDDAILRHGVARKEVAFVQKPFTPAVLVRKVREVLDRAA
ncbi:MAG TPA: PAS domain S-box protein [Kofleriaceae bacterium]|nr:PAS domain S-box protein [Kofleriaceae bacterium]